MYRLIPHVSSVLDVGFGSIDSMLTVRQINGQVDYTGVDGAAAVVAAAAPYADARTRFRHGNFFDYNGPSVELVQAWSFVYATDRPWAAIDRLYGLCTRYCLFDVRATHLPHDILDEELARGELGGKRIPYPLLSWRKLDAFLSGLEPAPGLEFAAYYYPPGPHVVLAPTLQPFVVSVVLDKESPCARWGRLPGPLY